MTPFVGFAPDMPSDTPGVITDCTQLISNERAMQAAPSAVGVTGLGALAAACRGAATLTSTTGTRRTIAGTQADLYEIQSGTWADVGSGSISGSSENRWSFAQFGSAAIAANNTQKVFASTSGNFTEITTAPIAEMVVAAKDFVLAFNINDGTYGDSPDRWKCSAFQDHTDWTAAAATQCTTGRLIGAGGAITAAQMLGEYVVAYKAKQMFLGQYVGPPVVWQWTPIPGEQGAVGPEAVADTGGGGHVFVGKDNIWLYDGTRAVPIGNEVRQWFYNRLSATFDYRTIVAHEKKNNRVWVFYPSTASAGNPDSAIVYHLGTRRWGRADRAIEAALSNYVAAGVTYDTLSTVSATYDGLPDIPWASSYWQTGAAAFSIFDTSHNLKSLIGSGEDCGLVTGDIGDDYRAMSINNVSLRFFTEPVSGTVTGQTKAGLGATLASGGTGTFANSKFDIRQDGRFHRFSFLLSGNVETSGISVSGRKTGGR